MNDLANNKERQQRLMNVQSKIRADAFRTTGKNVDTLEEGLRQKLERLRQISIAEEPFTYSLQKVHDRSFIHKLLPSI